MSLTEPMTIDAIKSLWCEALRSGRYRQGCQGKLLDQAGLYSPLGVLADAIGRLVHIGKGKWRFAHSTMRGSVAYLAHLDTAKIDGLADPTIYIGDEVISFHCQSLIQDDHHGGLSFQQIADRIEDGTRPVLEPTPHPLDGRVVRRGPWAAQPLPVGKVIEDLDELFTE